MGDLEVLNADAPVVETPPVDELAKNVPPLPANAEKGEVSRTAGPTAEATLEANVGIGASALPTGVPDGAIGHHSIGENEPVPGMVGIMEAFQEPVKPVQASATKTKAAAKE